MENTNSKFWRKWKFWDKNSDFWDQKYFVFDVSIFHTPQHHRKVRNRTNSYILKTQFSTHKTKPATVRWPWQSRWSRGSWRSHGTRQPSQSNLTWCSRPSWFTLSPLRPNGKSISDRQSGKNKNQQHSGICEENRAGKKSCKARCFEISQEIFISTVFLKC